VVFSYLNVFLSKLSDRDPELEQAAVARPIIGGLGLFCFLWLSELSNWHWIGIVAISYLAGTLLILTGAILAPERMPVRSKLGICLDTCTATFAMTSGAATAGFLGMFLLIAIGNGLRFGRNHMNFAVVTGVLGFVSVILTTPYWQQNLTLSLGVLAWLIVLPYYIGSLLHKLEQATREARQANKARREFLANMSHEIRTPLTAIIGFAEASLDSDQSMQERMAGLKTIVQNGAHLHAIVDDILDFSKIEAGKLELEYLDTDLFNLAREVEDLVKRKAVEKNIVFKLEYIPPLPRSIATDPLRLKQVLINLCSNAIKFTNEGFVLVQFRCDPQEEVLRISVIDTGIGLSEQQIQDCLDPFQQAEAATSRKYGGTGLGLPLSNHLIELLGGSLNIYSALKKGSTFEICLNLSPLDTSTLIYNMEQWQQSSIVESSHRDHHIRLHGDVLLVDDNETNQQLFSLFLRRLGVSVTIADSGISALKETVYKNFDLIYMDMHLPQLSGLDTVKKLREIGYSKPIVALTANATSEYRHLCLRAGCDDFLAKPILRSQFEQVCARYLHPAAAEDFMPEPIFSSLLQHEPEFADLVEKFVNDLHTTQGTIEMLMRTKNWQELKEVLHTLKGTAGGLGYPVLTDLAGKIEFQLISENYDAVDSLSIDLKRLFNRIFEGMQLTRSFSEFSSGLS